MERRSVWLIAIACIGVTATIVAVGLLWFAVTNPVATAQLLSRGL
jgi:hypothetical protein